MPSIDCGDSPLPLAQSFSPAGRLGLALNAEPALTQALVHVNLGVVALPGHVIDALTVAVHVALDDAAFLRKRLLFGLAPTASPEVPWRCIVSGEHAALGPARLLLLGHIGS